MYTYTTFISKRTVEQIGVGEHTPVTVLISLNSPPAITPGSSEVKLVESAWSKILKLEFHDADLDRRSIDPRIDDLADKSNLVLFNEEHAVAILKFLREHQESHEGVIVHCEGGISRSAAVAKFIAQIYNLDFLEGYSLYNRHVYSTLSRVYGKSTYGEGLLGPQELPGITTGYQLS
jgi:predicted protein tyrosine phosphatase